MFNDVKMKIRNDFEVNNYLENPETRKSYRNKTVSFEKAIKSLLIKSKLEFHVIEKRLKGIISLKNKIGKKKSENPTTVANFTSAISDDTREITDLSGVRIIVFHLEDVRLVLNLICLEYDIDEINSNFFLSNSEHDRFGYQSVHVIVIWESIKIEVQIRTVLQHAWAAISHKMDYKSLLKSPYELKRKLSRLSGLIEIADNEFNEIKSEFSNSKMKQTKSLFIEQIDYSSLSSYFINPNRFLWYIKCCEFSGLEKMEPYLSIPKIFDLRGYYKEIVECCQSLSLLSIREFDEFLRTNLIKFKKAISLYLRHGQQSARVFTIDQRLLFLMHVEMNSSEFQKICSKNGYHKSYADLVIKVKNELLL